MTFHEGKVWSVWIRFVNDRAAKLTKRVYVVAPSAEQAMFMVKAAVAPTGAVEYCSLTDSYDGLVTEGEKS